MIIKIKCDDRELILSDDELDNLNFVDVYFKDEIITASIEELYTAVKAFYEKRTRELKHDKLI